MMITKDNLGGRRADLSLCGFGSFWGGDGLKETAERCVRLRPGSTLRCEGLGRLANSTKPYFYTVMLQSEISAISSNQVFPKMFSNCQIINKRMIVKK